MTTDSTRLLPCPFCGGEAILRGEDGDMTPSVACRECESDGRWCENVGDAIAAWNRRADTSNQAGADAERALARFGAEVVREFWLDLGDDDEGFVSFPAPELDYIAARLGIMHHGFYPKPAPGIAEAVDRLTGGAA